MSSATPGIGRVMSIHSGIDDGPDSFDALRDLFLGGPEAAAFQPAPDRPAPQITTAPPEEPAPAKAEARPVFPLIEALVLGHLPVQQFPWVMQYARDVATVRGAPVALLRIREGEATLDLVGGDEAPDTGPTATLEQALASIAGKVRGLIVRVDAASEPLLPALPSVDALTLLTGADEAAVVGSYRTIKSLIGAMEDSAPALRLAIMGSTPERALPAAEKIQKAVTSHLQHEITVSACLARIASGRSTLLFRGLLTDDIGMILNRAREALLAGASRSEPQPARPATPPPSLCPAPHLAPPDPAELAPSPVMSRLGHASPATPAQHAAGPAPSRTSPERSDRPTATRPAQPPHASRPVQARPDAPSLALHIGLTPTPITSPLHPGVEFATDTEGGLNLLIHAPTTTDTAPAVVTLLSAASWAKSHAALIAMALQRAELTKAPTLHLLTSAPKGCSAIAEAGIHLHLLSRVEVEGRWGWFCTEIG